MGVSEPHGTTSEKSDSDPSSARFLARTSHRRTAGRLHGYVERADVIIARARPRLDHLCALSLFGGAATCSLDGLDPTLGRSLFVSIRHDCVAVVPRVALGFSALKAFIVVNRQTRKILAEFETREEAEAFRDGLIIARATGKSPLSIRSTLGDCNDQEAGAAGRAEKRGHAGPPLRGKRRRGPRRPGS